MDSEQYGVCIKAFDKYLKFASQHGEDIGND